jgi:hypothetical protein
MNNNPIVVVLHTVNVANVVYHVIVALQVLKLADSAGGLGRLWPYLLQLILPQAIFYTIVLLALAWICERIGQLIDRPAAERSAPTPMVRP